MQRVSSQTKLLQGRNVANSLSNPKRLLTTPVLGSLAPLLKVEAKVLEQLSS